jgi:glycine cleavage system aminomethyltransferase T
MAYVPADRSGAGETLQIDVRGKAREGTIVTKPIYPAEG